jgi:hypothetical protein
VNNFHLPFGEQIPASRIYGANVVQGSQRFLFTNGSGYDIFKETASVVDANVILASGMYWLNLQNATTENGNAVYWDQNSGVGCMSPGCPSEASSNGIGTIPSESFEIFGPRGATPEPGSIVLLGSGMLVLAQVKRCKPKFGPQKSGGPKTKGTT